MSKLDDLMGKRYGRLVVVGRAPSGKDGAARWRCVCDCGGESTPHAQNLKTELTKSCGCLKREALVRHNLRR